MKTDNPFDKYLEVNRGRIPENILDAAVYTNDTLNIAWLSAQSIFGDKSTPEIALAIYDRLQQAIKA